jgi:hypothetical protein
MKPDWRRLLTLQEQPRSLRECYELVEDFFAALTQPPPEQAMPLHEDEAARLGYLISAARLVAGMGAHPSWVQLEQRLKGRQAGAGQRVLLAADDGINALDELAQAWGFRKGLDSNKLVQVAEYRAC